jgi:hypothetical protein
MDYTGVVAIESGKHGRKPRIRSLRLILDGAFGADSE